MIDAVYVMGAGTSVYAGAPTMNNLMKEAHINKFFMGLTLYLPQYFFSHQPFTLSN